MAENTDKTVITERSGEEVPATRKIGHYEVVAELGRGGMGTVYRAYEPSLNRYVAIKILATHLADDAALVGRFAREAKAVAALNHPNVVHIYLTGETEGLPYFVMECIEGETLADLIRQQTTLPPRQAAQLLLEAASGLAAAHDRGIIHRDIKPSNLMLDTSGTLKITDFGIAQARDIGDKLTTTGQIVGTTGYVSPEVFKGHAVDSRSDIFSLGIVLYEMLVGTSPFDDPSPMGLMLQVVEQPVPDVQKLNPKVDKPLADILVRMTEKDPANRYQTCHELVDDLKRYLAGKPLASKAHGSSAVSEQPAPAANQRKRRSWPLVVLLLVAGGAAAGWWWGAPLWQAQAPAPSVDAEVYPAAEPMAEELAVTDTETPVNEPVEGADTSLDQEDTVDLAGGTTDNLQAPLGAEDPGGQPVVIVDDQTSNAAEVKAPQVVLEKSAARPAEVEALVQPPVTASAATAMPAHTVVLAEGDPALTGQIRQLIYTALKDGGHPQREPGFVPGINRVIQGRQLDIAAIREDALATGVRYLVLASAEVLDVSMLEFYGQRDTYYTTRIELTLLDLHSSETLGTWGEQVQYTNINAHHQTDRAVLPMLRELVAVLP